MKGICGKSLEIEFTRYLSDYLIANNFYRFKQHNP